MLGNLWRKLSSSYSRSSPPKGKPSRPARFRPTVEALEDRALPVITLTAPTFEPPVAPATLPVIPFMNAAGQERNNGTRTYANESPSLRIENLPTGTRSLALVMIDNNSVTRNSSGQFVPAPGFVQWVAYNISPAGVLATGSIAANIRKDPEPFGSTGLKQGLNGNGVLEREAGLTPPQIQALGGVGYLGPAPPDGVAHTYEFRVFALDESQLLGLNGRPLAAGASWGQVQLAMGLVGGGTNHVIESNTLDATFRDPLTP